eukprot:gene13149-3941_t
MELGLEDLFSEPPPKISTTNTQQPGGNRHDRKRPHLTEETDSNDKIKERKPSSGNGSLIYSVQPALQDDSNINACCKESPVEAKKYFIPDLDKALQICRMEKKKLFDPKTDEKKEKNHLTENKPYFLSRSYNDVMDQCNSFETSHSAVADVKPKSQVFTENYFNEGKGTKFLNENKSNCKTENNFNNKYVNDINLEDKNKGTKKLSWKRKIHRMVGPKIIKKAVEKNASSLEDFFDEPIERPLILSQELLTDVPTLLAKTLLSRSKILKKKGKKKRYKERKKKKEAKMKHLSLTEYDNGKDIVLGPPKCDTPHKWPVRRKSNTLEMEEKVHASIPFHTEESCVADKGAQGTLKTKTENIDWNSDQKHGKLPRENVMKKPTEVENSLLAMVSRSEIDLSVSETKEASVTARSKRGGQKKKKRANKKSNSGNQYRTESKPKVQCKYFLDGKCRQLLERDIAIKKEAENLLPESCLENKCKFVAVTTASSAIETATATTIATATVAAELSLGVPQETIESETQLPNLYASLI